MVAVIIAIAAAGIFGVSHIKGWFDKSDETTAVLTDFRGIITLQRDGVAYAATDETVLRKGDRITCDTGATVKIASGENYISLGQNAEAEIINPASDGLTLKINIGEAFVNTGNTVYLEFADKQTEISNAVASLSVRKGAQSISVYYGSVGEADEGSMIEWIGDKETVRDFSVKSLNDFNISQIRKANETKTLVFSDDELDRLENERWEQMYGTVDSSASTAIGEDKTASESRKTTKKVSASASETKKEPVATVARTAEASAEKTTKVRSTKKKTTRRDYSLYLTAATSSVETVNQTETEKSSVTSAEETTEENEEETTKKASAPKPAKTTKAEKTTNPVKTTKAEKTTKPTTTKKAAAVNPTDATKPATEEHTQAETEAPETTNKKLTCTITIRCDTILDNTDNLDPAKAPYVPDNGVILREVTVEFEEGETVFDVLNRVCKQYGIPLEYSWTPMYDSYYIEGINNLYEFDCGSESGWMYKVNGWFPNYGCSSYYLTGGEKIVWCYTCNGLGEDVGAERWE